MEIEELLLSDNEPSKDDDNDEGPMSLVNNGTALYSFCYDLSHIPLISR